MPCCKINNHECEVSLEVPLSLRKEIGQDTIKIDKCLSNEIAFLWQLNIRTIGCCCGHGNRKKPYIEVDEKDRIKMVEQGYRELPLTWNGNEYEGYNCFMPRSQLEWQVMHIG